VVGSVAEGESRVKSSFARKCFANFSISRFHFISEAAMGELISKTHKLDCFDVFFFPSFKAAMEATDAKLRPASEN
jgi:hypothetical protein